MGELKDNRTARGIDGMETAKEAQTMADMAVEEARELVAFFDSELKRCAEARNRSDLPRNTSIEFCLQRRERCSAWALEQAERNLIVAQAARAVAYGR